MSALNEIVPKDHQLVMDLVRDAGVNVDDWKNFKGGERKAASNPKYCYEWAFVEPKKVVVLNLWHASLQERDGVVFHDLNQPELAKQFRQAKNPSGAKRAMSMDVALRTAVRDALPVRVVVCEGARRTVKDATAKASQVHKRLLDPVPWAVTAYDLGSGQCTVTRGAQPKAVASGTDDSDAKAARRRDDVPRSATTHWVDDDPGYEAWLEAHPRGFMANVNKGLGGRYLKIHRASHNLPDRSNEGSVNPRTGGSYSKVTAEDLDDLETWAIGNLPKLGRIDEGNYCEVCTPENDASIHAEPTIDPDEYVLTADRLRARGQLERPEGISNPTSVQGVMSIFYRDPRVRAWTLERAGGRCELCGTTAPFVTNHGTPYLESHHIVPLAEAGPDTPDNTAALCPNCHRNLHHGAERNELRGRLGRTIADMDSTEKSRREAAAGRGRGRTNER